nr:hypothetical protein [Tanacetum cinerariifolium]
MDNLEERIANLEMVFAYLKNKKILERQQNKPNKVIEKLSQEKVSQQDALEKFKWKVVRDHKIKVLGEVNVELESGSKKLREKLSKEDDTEDEAFEEFSLTLDNVLEKLSQENEKVIEMANNQAEALSFDKEVTDECLDDEQIEEKRPTKWIRVTQKEMIKYEKLKKG